MSIRGPWRVPARIRMAGAFAILGVFNALMAAGVTWYLQLQGRIGVSTWQAWDSFVMWVWPSAIMMTAGDMHDPPMLMQLLVLALSAAVNGCLYGVLGLLIGGAWEKLAARR